MNKSGEPFPISNMQQNFNRKGFLLRAGLAIGAVMLNGCIRKINGRADQYKHIQGTLKGPDHKAGHILRDKLPLPTPTTTSTTDTLIIGSGISGLSAGRWLKKQQHNDFMILELEQHTGGNAASHQNATSAYPLGAHYITIANNEDQLLIDFLQELNVITHFEKELPFYNEFYLCFDPEERLLINGQWQEGLIPKFGTGAEDARQIETFFKLIEEFKKAKGSDGKDAFNLPVDHASADEKYRKLDRISFKTYLSQQGLTSKYLLWYLDYCCKDDYGQHIANVSAWAGINYFAGHKGKAANAEEGAVLTWPEGNAWLANRLKEELQTHIRTAALAYQIKRSADGTFEVYVHHLKTNTTEVITAKNIIMASPQFVNKRILGDLKRDFNYGLPTYAPWMVANITLSGFDPKGLSWDNVPYGTPSVGYVYAGHQHLKRIEDSQVISFYLPLCKQESRIARLAAYARSYEQWLDQIIPELEYMHPGITNLIDNIEIWVWGHGMVSPTVNYIWGGEREKGLKPVADRIFFAHTDLSGVSLFEEAFHQGIRAAKQLLGTDHGN